jgi:tight adherence protein B
VTLLAALMGGLFAYLAAGYLVGTVPRIDLSRREGPRLSPRQIWLIQAGLDITPAKFHFWTALVGMLGFLAGYGLTGTVWVAIPPGIALAFFPRWFFGRRRVRRLAEVQEAWPDGLRHLVASVRSGMSLPMALEELARTGPDGLRAAFVRYPVLARLFGVRPALEIVRDELADPTTDRVIEVLVLANERGGSLVPEILHDLAEATTQDIRTLEEVRTNSLEQRLNARIVFAVPWFVLVVLTIGDGPYRDFYRSAGGFVVVFVAAVLSLLGAWWVARLGREPVEERVFGGGSAEVRP